jgi:hypothetical protein
MSKLQRSINSLSILTILLLTLSFEASGQQKYISRAIIAFSGGAYERTILDINTALSNTEDIAESELGKAYFYRGIAKIRLLSQNQEHQILGSNPYLSAYNDIAQAIKLEPGRWTTKAEKEYLKIYDELVLQGEISLRQARAVGGGSRAKILLGRSKDYFTAALSIKTVPTVRNKLTEINNLVTGL